jgi:hypothetical protein
MLLKATVLLWSKNSIEPSDDFNFKNLPQLVFAGGLNLLYEISPIGMLASSTVLAGGSISESWLFT